MELIVEFLQILNILSLISTLLDFVPEDALSVKESGLVEFRAVVIDKLPRLIGFIVVFYFGSFYKKRGFRLAFFFLSVAR